MVPMTLKIINNANVLAADTIAFTEGGAEAMRIDSDGDVGIGTNNPQRKLHVLSGTGTAQIQSTTTVSTLYFGDTNSTAIDNQGIGSSGNDIAITTGGAIGIFITNVGTLTAQRATSVNFNFNGYASGVGTGNQIRFGNDNGTVGSIVTSGSSTAYNTSSDYRLKENVSYDFDATTRLKQLKPARFNFKADANKIVDGFLAHEVQSVIPEAITGTKDATVTKEKVVVNVYDNVIAENIEQADWETGKIADEKGNTRYPIDSTWEASKIVPVYQGIDQAKLTPLLTKALQEAIAKIESLEARLTALES
jgi:hypothetical protein